MCSMQANIDRPARGRRGTCTGGKSWLDRLATTIHGVSGLLVGKAFKRKEGKGGNRTSSLGGGLYEGLRR